MYQYYDETLGKWVNGKPTKTGQLYRYTDAAGGIVESYWVEPE
jgi:hypothetical protein